MNTPLETGSDKPRSRQPEAARVRSNIFSFRTVVDFPTREQTRVRTPGRAWRAQWTDHKP